MIFSKADKMHREFLYTFFFLLITTNLLAQNLAPTNTEALLRVRVTDLEEKPSQGEIITFINKSDQATFEGITNENGQFEILIPKGQTYIVNYRNFGYDHQYAEHEIPAYEGKLVSKINIRYQMPSKTVLDDIQFKEDNVSIDANSFSALDKLAQLLKVKSNMRVQISAHSDDRKGNNATALTAKQAENIREYLINQGIEVGRIESKGYGAQFPMASNSSEAGRKKNNRIEIEILK